MIGPLVKKLTELHGVDKLPVKDGEKYFLYFNDGLFTFYYDEDELTIKAEVELHDEGKAFVYEVDDSIESFIDM